jgi:DNA-3-methyladenine glycosylase II
MVNLGLIHPLPPYDFARTIRASQYGSVLNVVREGVYRRAYHVAGQVALVELTGVGRVEAPAIAVKLLASGGPAQDSTAAQDSATLGEAILQLLRRTFSAEADLTPFYRHAQTDPILWNIVAPQIGIHELQTPSLFEALALTIIEQQISLSAARRGERWLVGWGGDSITYGGETYYTFPSPARIAAASVEELAPLKITFKRIKIIMDVARQQTSGAVDLEMLRQGTVEDAYRWLINLKGVGHWTAAWTLTRGLGKFTYVGSADVALQAAVNRHYHGKEGRASRELTDETFARYGEFAGLAAFYTLMGWAEMRYGSSAAAGSAVTPQPGSDSTSPGK